MASLMIHHIIADKYCKNNNIKDTFEFITGNIAPDILPNKESNHYVLENYNPKSYTDVIMNRVNLSKFCRVNVLANDYIRGYFLHLVTDYIFYNQYLSKLDSFKKLDNGAYEYAFVKDYMYTEYDRVANYLTQAYPDIDMEILIPRARYTLNEDMKIFDKESLEKVMDFCAKIDLDKLYKNIKNDNYTQLIFKFQ